MRPMLATAGDRVPPGDQWRHEVKWDGVRAIVEVSASGSQRSVTLRSRNGNDITAAWPELLTPPARLREAVLDGEIIALNDRGVPDFRTLAERIHLRKPATVARYADRIPAILMVFDLLRVDDKELTGLPWQQRRARLQALDLAASGWQLPPAYEDGAMLWAATREQGLEGVVSKRTDAPYRPGERSRYWLKFAHRHRGSYVVGGWRPQVGTTERLAALLVGEVTPTGLQYRGRVGSGIGPRQARRLAESIDGLARSTSPFADEVPAVDAAGTHWIEPQLVVDVDTHGIGHPRLRQPSYQGLRMDLDPEEL
jgi:bifunctional non-homologous end joining protein LigD